ARSRLDLVRERQADVPAVAKKFLNGRKIARRADDQDFADARQHQRRQRIVDRRLIIHRQELLAHRPRQGRQPRPTSPRENDSFHLVPLRGRCRAASYYPILSRRQRRFWLRARRQTVPSVEAPEVDKRGRASATGAPGGLRACEAPKRWLFSA